MDPLLEQLRHHPLPAVSAAIRAEAGAIAGDWIKLVRELIPRLDDRTSEELRDNVPRILDAMAVALASDDPGALGELIRQSPAQGLTRFHQDYTVTEIMQEDRLLREIVVAKVEDRLGRQMDRTEAAALHATVDMMFQQAVAALVERQQARLRAASEKELKFLSFLSHDLNNNLGSVRLSLTLLRETLAAPGADPAEAMEAIESAERGIDETIEGMRRLLQHEVLRKGDGNGRKSEPVDLGARARHVAARFGRVAAGKGVAVAVNAPPGVVATSDPQLIGLVLQNLIGNAVKYSSRGTVRITARYRGEGGGRRCVLAVSDEGPGIAADRRATLFEAFRRGDVHGQEGVGLGLAIASQAARLLGGELGVESEVGAGSTFWLALPESPPPDDGGGRPASERPNHPERA